MAYDEGVAQRLREALQAHRDISPSPNSLLVEKKMFGGLAFLLSGNMCCGVVGEQIMARVGPEAYAGCLALPHAREMDFTGKALRGFVYVDPPGFESDEDLAAWVSHCVRFARSLPPK